MSFKDPWVLLFILFVLAIVYLFHQWQKPAAIRYPSLSFFKNVGPSWKPWASRNMIFVRMIVLALFLVALAGPRDVLEFTEVKAEGINIVLAVDASGSMAAEDFIVDNKRVNRLEIVKQTVYVPHRRI